MTDAMLVYMIRWSRSGIKGWIMRNDSDRRIVLDTPIERRLPMPNSLQYPLELERRLLRRWERLRTATAIKGPAIHTPNAIFLAAATVPVACALVGTMPPRDRNDDDPVQGYSSKFNARLDGADDIGGSC